jgi:CBS domain-containing protein
MYVSLYNNQKPFLSTGDKMIVKELLEHKGRAVHTILPDDTIGVCVTKLTSKKVGALLVVDAKESPVGIITERDILRITAKKKGKIWDLKVKAVMTPESRLITTTEDESVEAVMQKMTQNHIRHLPIVSNEKIVGILSIGDVIKNLLSDARFTNEQLQNYITAG